MLLAILLVLFVFRAETFQLLRYIDKHYFSETLKDIKAQIQTDEDWDVLGAYQIYNYAWRDNVNTQIKIAHGLGGSGAQQNTVRAFLSSRAQGVSFYEVDIWLDQNQQLRCHHGPEPPDAFRVGDCTLEKLVEMLIADEYLVLDIKTSFRETFDVILKKVGNSTRLTQIIFQLYLPEHIQIFDNARAQHSLIGPIVSVYKSKRSLSHIYDAISAHGVKAFTFPYPRMVALNMGDESILHLTHPVQSCGDYKDALRHGIEGFYMQPQLTCFYKGQQ